MDLNAANTSRSPWRQDLDFLFFFDFPGDERSGDDNTLSGHDECPVHVEARLAAPRPGRLRAEPRRDELPERVEAGAGHR